ncbi:MAG: response regulator transcription factor [Sphingomonadaceae bacterium]|nr:response regulator transcription factor [Sphingomonadaceae bacterium]
MAKPATDGLEILYVEDDADAARAVVELAATHGDRVSWEATGEAGLRRAGMQSFDVIILDRMLPDMEGLQIVERLRAAGLDVPVLMLSALARSENRIEGLDAGVDDYLGKPYEPEELVARVRALHRRASGQAQGAVILFGAFECHVKARTAFRSGKHIPLSPKEFELFRYFMENAGETVTREMLLRDVWKMNFDPQTNVVDVNIGRLRRKLEDGFDKPALETIWGAGYRLTRGE